MVNAFGCDDFFALLNESSSKPMVVKNLLLLTTAFLDDYSKHASALVNEALASDGHEEDPPVPRACSDVLTVCKCIVTLLDVEAAETAECLRVLSKAASGANATDLLSTLRLHLATPFWEKKADELLKAGDLKRAKLWGEELSDQLANFDVALDPVPQWLTKAIMDLPRVKGQGRPGQLSKVEATLRQAIITVSSSVIEMDDTSQLQESDLVALDQGLELAAREPGVLELRKKLSVWRGQKASELASRKLNAAMQQTLHAWDTSPKEAEKLLLDLCATVATPKVLSEAAQENGTVLLYRFMEMLGTEDASASALEVDLGI